MVPAADGRVGDDGRCQVAGRRPGPAPATVSSDEKGMTTIRKDVLTVNGRWLVWGALRQVENRPILCRARSNQLGDSGSSVTAPISDGQQVQASPQKIQEVLTGGSLPWGLRGRAGWLSHEKSCDKLRRGEVKACATSKCILQFIWDGDFDKYSRRKPRDKICR